MKTTATTKIEHRLARHDRRAGSKCAFPASDYLFRPGTDITLGRARLEAGDVSARRAFRRMTTDLLTKQNRPDPLEMVVFGAIIALVAWSLVSLLIVLTQTANG